MVARAHQGLTPKYFCGLMRKPQFSVVTLRPLLSADRRDLLVFRTRTALAQHRALAVVGPSLWNDLPRAIHRKILTGVPFITYFCVLGAITLREFLNS